MDIFKELEMIKLENGKYLLIFRMNIDMLLMGMYKDLEIKKLCQEDGLFGESIYCQYSVLYVLSKKYVVLYSDYVVIFCLLFYLFLIIDKYEFRRFMFSFQQFYGVD